jgi:thioredoxin-dependent peroxiredoxin
MSEVYLRKQKYHTLHNAPEIGSLAPLFTATKTDLSELTLDKFKGNPVIINVYPSIDTQVCFDSVKQVQDLMSTDTPPIVLCISMDLPFALKRVAEGEGLRDIIFLSDFRNREFGDTYGFTLVDGPMAGLLARAVIILDNEHRITHLELVHDIATPPHYEEAWFSCGSAG